MTATVSSYFGQAPVTPPAAQGIPGAEDLDEGDTDHRPGNNGWTDPSRRPAGKASKPDDAVTDKSLAQVSKQQSVPPETSPFAYVFYATRDAYACSVLVNIDRLQNKLKVKYPIYVLVTDHVSEPYLEAFKSRNVVVSKQTVPPLAEGSAGYYQDCLVKLLAFQMHHINTALKRVIVVDADQLILKNLDHLFDGLPEADLAAPRAYWIGKEVISSTFMLIGLSDRLWERIEPAMTNITKDKYDMDLVNELLSDTVLMLPGNFISINSHWETWGIPKWYTGDIKPATTSATKAVASATVVAGGTVMLQTQKAEKKEKQTKQKEAETAQRLPAGKGVEVKTYDDGSPSANKLVKREASPEPEAEALAPGGAKSPTPQAVEPDTDISAAVPKKGDVNSVKPVIGETDTDADDVSSIVAASSSAAAAPAAASSVPMDSITAARNKAALGSSLTTLSDDSDVNPLGTTTLADGSKVPKEQHPNYQILYDVYEQASVMHFFALGKPWTWSVKSAEQNRKNAHPLFYEMFKEWRTAAMLVCPPGLIDEV